MLKELRLKNNLSQEKLARHCDVTRETIRNIESGKCYPNVILAIKIAKFFETSVEDIFGGRS